MSKNGVCDACISCHVSNWRSSQRTENRGKPCYKSHLCNELNSKNSGAEKKKSRLTSVWFVIYPIRLSELRDREHSNIILVGKLQIFFCLVFDLLSSLLKRAFHHLIQISKIGYFLFTPVIDLKAVPFPNAQMWNLTLPLHTGILWSYRFSQIKRIALKFSSFNKSLHIHNKGFFIYPKAKPDQIHYK